MTGQNRQRNGQKNNRQNNGQSFRSGIAQNSNQNQGEFRDYKYLIVKNLNRQTVAGTLFDYFSKFSALDSAVLNIDETTDKLDGSATITFRQIPRGREREALMERHVIDGRTVHAEFSKETDNRNTQKSFESSNLNAYKLTLGNFISTKDFVEQWSATENIKYRVVYTKRSVDIFFTHLGVQYKMNYNFKEVMGDMIVEKENSHAYFTIPLKYPPRYWRQNEKCEETKFKKSAGGWERVTTIPIEETTIPDSRLKEPILPMPRLDSVKLGAWNVIRISFSPTARNVAIFNREMQKAADFNLVPRDKNKMKNRIQVTLAKDLPPPLTYMDRLQFGFNFSVLYALESILSHNYIDEYNIDKEFYSTIKDLDSSVVCGILDLIALNKRRVWDPMFEFRLIWNKMELKVCQPRKVPNHCTMLRKVIITPSTLFIQPPNLETTNRVVRHYKDHADRFLRVQFMDEGFNRIGAARLKTTNEAIYNRIFDVLKRGIQIGNRRYEFLAFSSSQLREHGCWFFATTPDLTPDIIRKWMGVFSHEKVVAKHAVRMGQCFSSTRPITRLEWDELENIKDVVHNGFTFSDGVGRIAPSLADEVATHMEIKTIPSAFQFRLGGAKGVLTVENSLAKGKVKIQLRPSQIKFVSKHLTLEVIRTSTFIHGYLNRQAITLLSALGVKDQVFLDLMANMLRNIDKILGRPEEAIRVLLNNTDEAGTAPAMATIIQAGFLEKGDPYIKNLLNLFRVNILKDLKKKAKIVVPQAAFLLGVMDESGVLEDGEVFVQVWDNSNNGTIKQVITGECVVFRNPCFHPGDIRVVNAVDRPELRHLINVIVFASKGFRDIPSMCSGGDLDGDDYTVYWDPNLMPARKNYPPMDYTAPKPRIVEDVTILDIQRFFVNYINNDNLGQIANGHLATADISETGALDGRCIKLAQLHSEAVDFPKSGKPARLTDDLIVRMFPDFMQKKDKDSYESKKVLGHIFRSIDKSDYKDYMSRLTEEASYDTRMYVPGMEYYIGEAREHKIEYNRGLLGIMNQSGVQTEAEIVSGYIIKWLKKGKSKTRYEQHESTMKAVKSFKSNWKKEFEREFLDDTRKTVDPNHRSNIDAKAAAWYYVTYHPEERRRDFSEKGSFLSFVWVVFDYVCEVAKKNRHRKDDPLFSQPIPDDVIEDQHEKHMHAKRFMVNDCDDEEDVTAEIVIAEEDSDYDSDNENEAVIYGTNIDMFVFNNTELERSNQNGNQENTISYQRPANAGSSAQRVVGADASMEDLMKAFMI